MKKLWIIMAALVVTIAVSVGYANNEPLSSPIPDTEYQYAVGDSIHFEQAALDVLVENELGYAFSFYTSTEATITVMDQDITWYLCESDVRRHIYPIEDMPPPPPE